MNEADILDILDGKIPVDAEDEVPKTLKEKKIIIEYNVSFYYKKHWLSKYKFEQKFFGITVDLPIIETFEDPSEYFILSIDTFNQWLYVETRVPSEFKSLYREEFNKILIKDVEPTGFYQIIECYDGKLPRRKRPTYATNLCEIKIKNFKHNI